MKIGFEKESFSVVNLIAFVQIYTRLNYFQASDYSISFHFFMNYQSESICLFIREYLSRIPRQKHFANL